MSISTRLFVSNLPKNYNEKTLKEAFSTFGEITNLDVKLKTSADNDTKIFAFVTINANNFNIESCIKHFTNVDFCGNRLYVTKARESFLERLQREREQTQQAKNVVVPNINHNKNPLHETLKSHKRKLKENHNTQFEQNKCQKILSAGETNDSLYFEQYNNKITEKLYDEKKNKSDEKRLESIKRKRQEFNEKKRIIKTGLTSIDKQTNKKVFYSDSETEAPHNQSSKLDNSNSLNIGRNKVALFDDNESDDETNFNIKKQFEGEKGQKILELQSKYKSDKRFILDERFAEEEHSEEDEQRGDLEEVELGQDDEKSKQFNILQDVLGVSITSKRPEAKTKTKLKQGMLRFDPTQPEHAKYLAPVELKQETVKKSKKKKTNKDKEEEIQEQFTPSVEVEKVEVSKEQFYKISDSLKETITQPNEFSLRNLFTSKVEDNIEENSKNNEEFIPLQIKKDKKIKNPLEPSDKNPFVYDSSDSENEEVTLSKPDAVVPEIAEPKIVWRENLFFSNSDNRLRDGLLFFNQAHNKDGHKDRRELKSLMKKRIYNKDRKNNMFQKKIGGRKKTMKKSFRKKFNK